LYGRDEIAHVLVRLARVASVIVNADHSMMLVASRSPIPQPTERQRIGNQIKAAFIFTRAEFVKAKIGHRASVDLFVGAKVYTV
jgi:hypothetical protein